VPELRPFRGLRYNDDIAGNIALNVAPPYDIIYDEWRERLYERSPFNIIRLIKTKDLPGEAFPDAKYSHAAGDIADWMKRGVLRLDDRPCIYLRSDTYKVDGELKTRFGFIALLKIEEFGRSVHPHERTLSAPKADRLKLVKATKTNLSQIFSIFRDTEGDIQSIIDAVAQTIPSVEFVDEQDITRRMWVIDDPKTIGMLTDLMKDRDIIIADGHHRYETALTYREFMESQRESDREPFDYVSMYFSNADAPGMTVLPTHRKVSEVSTYNQNTFFTELAKLFDVTYYGPADYRELLRSIAVGAESNNRYVVYTCDGFGTATMKDTPSPKDLDVDILHSVIIEKLLGISREDIASGKHVHFCKSPEHAVEDVVNHKDQISFLMNPVTPDELFRTVLKGVRMPQKSTYFYPKTMSGLVMYLIDRESIS